MVTLLKRLLPNRLTRFLVSKNASPVSPVRSLPPPTHPFFDDELFKCHTATSFQRLFGSNNGHPETKFISPLSAQRQPHTRDMVTSARTASSNGATHQKHPSQTPSSASHDYTKLFSTLGTDVCTGKDVIISHAERQQALACFGAIGSGKSTLALNLILQDIRQNMSVVLVEPHGDLSRAVLAGIPDSRLKDVVYLDLTDCATFPIGLNPFQCDNLQDAAAVAKIANFVQHTFERIWNLGPHTPLLAMVLRNVTRTLIENPGSSFSDIPLLFHDATAREKLVSNVTTLQTKQFWQQYNDMSPRERRELLSSTENKIDAFLNEPLIANVLSQAHSTIAFGSLLNERKIVLLNLSPQLEEIGRLLGSLFLGLILMAAYQRASIPESERIPCHVYVDEWSRFCSDDLAVLIAESRKFKVIIGGLFNQTLETISDSNRATALQAGTLVVFRVSGEDAKVLCQSFDATPSQEQSGVEPIRAPVTEVVSHLLRRGHTNPTIVKFVTDYLMPLDTLMRSFGHSNQTFGFGVSIFSSTYAIQGQQLLNECLFNAMQSGRADGFIPPLALFTLGGAAEPGITAVFYDDIKRDPFFTGHLFHGLYESANRFGQASFLSNTKAVDKLVKKHAKRKIYGRVTTPGPSFIAMLKRLREVMEILAKDPLMTETGLFQPVYRQRTYTDMSAQIANELSQQDNYVARVKTLTGEYTIRTNPLPTLMTEEQLNARIGDIKRRMREQGLCRPAHEVEEEVRLRHEQLRQRNDAPPPSHSNGTNRRRFRPRPPTDA